MLNNIYFKLQLLYSNNKKMFFSKAQQIYKINLFLIYSFQYGDTPLHTSARYGHAGVMRILISALCKVSDQNKVSMRYKSLLNNTYFITFYECYSLRIAIFFLS